MRVRRLFVASEYRVVFVLAERIAAAEQWIVRAQVRAHRFDFLPFRLGRIGDVRDYEAVLAAVRHADVVFHAAALKQVPSCEYAPVEAVKTKKD